MHTKCRFLVVSRHGPACSIGVNFYAPGQDCELCRDCPVPALDDSAHCKYLEFSAIFVVGKTGEDETVEAGMGCALSGSGPECQSCSAFEPMPPGSRETVEGRGAAARFPVVHP